MKWGDAEIKRLRTLWELGHQRKSIASIMGITEAAVLAALERFGVPLRNGKARRGPRRVYRKPVKDAPCPAPRQAMSSEIPWPSKERLMAGR